jgi:hypothetical protein
LVIGLVFVCCSGKKHPAGTDIFAAAGNPEKKLILFIAACDLNIEQFSRPDYFPELHPANPRQTPIACPGAGNKVGDHLQLGDSRENRVIRKVAREPGRVRIDSHGSDYFTFCHFLVNKSMVPDGAGHRRQTAAGSR